MSKIVATATSVATPIGDTPEQFYLSLMNSRSAVSKWKGIDTQRICSKIGGDLSHYDTQRALLDLRDKISESYYLKAAKLIRRLPWATQVSLVVALKAAARLNLCVLDLERTGIIVGSSDISHNYHFKTFLEFQGEPEFIDSLYAVHCLDTDHGAVVAEALGIKGSAHIVGGACASGNLALKQAIDEIRYHDMDRIFVVSPIFDYSPVYLHSLGHVGAIVTDQFLDNPAAASRPFDTKRCGFVPSQAAGCVVLEKESVARSLGHKPLAEVLASETSSDTCHLPTPNEDGQRRCMTKALKAAGVSIEQINYVCMHATSTEIGDVSEMRALTSLFGKSIANLKGNAAKSLLGHACGASAIVELVGAIEQVNAGRFHGTANIDSLDPSVTFDILSSGAQSIEVEYFMKNAFGFGGINSCSVWRRWTE